MATDVASESPFVSPVRRSLAVLGDSWTLLILRYAFTGARRYSDWRRQMKIPDLVLSDRLQRLVDNAVFERRSGGDIRRHEYWLTERGLDLYALLVVIWNWESTWVPAEGTPYARLTHLDCGHEIRPLLTCTACGEVTGPRDVFPETTARPALSSDPTAEMPKYRRSTASAHAEENRWLRWQTIQIIGDRWSSALLGALFLARHGFDEIQQALKVPSAILANRLTQFEALGIIQRERHAEDARRRFYRLTEKGLALFPITMVFFYWGERWLGRGHDEFRIIHRACGKPFRPRLACSHCHAPLVRRAIRLGA